VKPLYLFGIFYFILLQASLAQSSLDLFTASGRFGFPQEAGEPIKGTSSEYGGLVNLKAPIVLSQKTIWYNDLTYVYSYVQSNAELGAGIANPVELSGFIFQTGLVQSINDKKKLQMLFAPRFMTDFENVNNANWQFGGMVLIENKYSDNLTMRFGLLYNQEMFGPSLTPLIYLDWQISDRWSIAGMAPIYIKVNYKVNKNLTAGFSHFALITSYRLGNPAYLNDYIERGSIDLTLFVRQRIWNNIFVEGRAGFAVDRYYEQYSEDQKLDLKVTLISFGDNRIPKNVMMKTGPVANLRLVYNLPIE